MKIKSKPLASLAGRRWKPFSLSSISQCQQLAASGQLQSLANKLNRAHGGCAIPTMTAAVRSTLIGIRSRQGHKSALVSLKILAASRAGGRPNTRA